ncbi:hypothetical protein F5051DRAFT_446123 [Lentinula edodes]|nr:hypothetical protein F5051DRAFT_446123 [Lentinula edodes]
MPIALDLDLGNVEAIPHVKLRTASPLPPPTLEDRVQLLLRNIEPLKGHHLVVPAPTRSFPSSVAVLVAPFELQPAPSTLQHKPPHTKNYPKTYFDPAPPEGSMEPHLHRRMLALLTAFPHRDGAGRWDDVVPATPSLDQSTVVWEQLMLEYLHHITDIPMSVPVPSDEPTSAVGEGVSSPPTPSRVPLFLPEQDSPTSPSPPPPSPSLPPLFGSVANLAIDLTGGDDGLYEPEESRRARVSEADGMDAVPKEEPL